MEDEDDDPIDWHEPTPTKSLSKEWSGRRLYVDQLERLRVALRDYAENPDNHLVKVDENDEEWRPVVRFQVGTAKFRKIDTLRGFSPASVQSMSVGVGFPAKSVTIWTRRGVVFNSSPPMTWREHGACLRLPMPCWTTAGDGLTPNVIPSSFSLSQL